MITPGGAAAPRILVAEHEPLCRRFLELALRAEGCAVVSGEGGAAAIRELEGRGSQAFEGVLVNPCLNGVPDLRLLARIRDLDSSLAMVAICDAQAGDSIHSIALESLRAGACDFLQKPLARERLAEAVSRAVSSTAMQRQSGRMRAKVGAVGRLQRATMGTADLGVPNAVEFYFRPEEAASGDFLRHFRLPGPRDVLIVTDVSGHEFDSAMVCGVVCGMMRGLIENGASLEQALTGCNHALLNSRGLEPGRYSTAVASVSIDYAANCMTTLLAGAPAPAWIGPDGWVETLGEACSSPLGWFADFHPFASAAPVPRGPVWMWTDGVDDLARVLGVHPLSAVSALLRAAREGTEPEWARNANDDLLAGRFLPSSPVPAACKCIEPLLWECPSPSDAGRIDDLQEGWRRSLRLAVPNLSAATLYDVLLASREAVLNALLHGCKEGQRARFQIARDSASGTISVRVRDPGGGFCAVREACPGGLDDGHRGLLLMRKLVSSLALSDGGASVTMTFNQGEKDT